MKDTLLCATRSLLTTTRTGLALLSLTGASALAANWTITNPGALGAEHSVSCTSDGYNIHNSALGPCLLAPFVRPPPFSFSTHTRPVRDSDSEPDYLATVPTPVTPPPSPVSPAPSCG